MEPKANQLWRKKTDHTKILTVICCENGYVAFDAPWMKSQSGCCLDVFYKRYETNNLKQMEDAKAVKPLVDALAEGKQLEFKHNNGQYHLCRASNLTGIVMSPHRYRIVTNDYI